MFNRKRILSLGLGLSLLMAQTAQADIIISPLDTTHPATEAVQPETGGQETTGQETAGPEGGGQATAGTGSQVSQGEPGQNMGAVSGVTLEAPGETQAGSQTQPGGLPEPGGGQIQPGGASEPGSGQGAGLEPGTQAQTAGKLSSAASYSTKEAVAVSQSQAPGTGQNNGSSESPSSAQIEQPVVSAQAAILYDATHDRVLFEKNADTRFYPASITKLMTALVVLEHANLNDTVTFSKSAVTNLESGAVTLKLAEGDKVSVKDCMYGLLLKSANEVANGLAEHVAGSVPKFADMMNAKARELGCTGTNFVNPNGLNDPNHYTTARDMAKIAKAAFENATLCQIDSTLSYKFPATKNANQERTLTPGHKMLYPSDSRYYEGIIGGKTGYTSLAGNTLVTCVEKDGVRMIAVILKAKSTQYVDTKAVLDYGYTLNASGSGSQMTVQGAKYHRWIQDGTNWQFELADGTRLKNACVTIDGADYVFDTTGKMLTGWQYLGNTWYCFKESGAMVKNGWMQDQNKWFYLGTDGQMVTDSTIDGKYYVGADGIWVQ